jgi:hypothetical protein
MDKGTALPVDGGRGLLCDGPPAGVVPADAEGRIFKSTERLGGSALCGLRRHPVAPAVTAVLVVFVDEGEGEETVSERKRRRVFISWEESGQSSMIAAGVFIVGAAAGCKPALATICC